MRLLTFQRLARYVTADTWARLRREPCPLRLCRCDVPQDLNGITLGDLLDLQGKSYAELLSVAPKVLLHLSGNKVARLEVGKAGGLANMVAAELERIGKMWQECRVQPTEAEKRAGAEALNFGPFGLVDWFAKRQGISDHDRVLQVPWLTVWQCLKIDSERTIYERRLLEAQKKKK